MGWGCLLFPCPIFQSAFNLTGVSHSLPLVRGPRPRGQWEPHYLRVHTRLGNPAAGSPLTHTSPPHSLHSGKPDPDRTETPVQRILTRPASRVFVRTFVHKNLQGQPTFLPFSLNFGSSDREERSSGSWGHRNRWGASPRAHQLGAKISIRVTAPNCYKWERPRQSVYNPINNFIN